MTLDELNASLEVRLAGRNSTIRVHDNWDGSQSAIALVDGQLFASWRAELAKVPVFDGKTARGPKNYHSLRFFDEPAGAN